MAHYFLDTSTYSLYVPIIYSVKNSFVEICLSWFFPHELIINILYHFSLISLLLFIIFISSTPHVLLIGHEKRRNPVLGRDARRKRKIGAGKGNGHGHVTGMIMKDSSNCFSLSLPSKCRDI